MDKDMKEGFFADQSSLDMEAYLIFDYTFESFVDPEEAAAHLCQEQSTAQWKRVDVDEDLRPQFGAKVIDLKVEQVLDKPSCPEMGGGEGPVYDCRVRIAHPHGNFGPSFPTCSLRHVVKGPSTAREFHSSN